MSSSQLEKGTGAKLEMTREGGFKNISEDDRSLIGWSVEKGLDLITRFH